MPLEDLHQAGKIQQRPAQPVHLIDDHAVDVPGLYVDEQSLQCLTFEIAASVAAIVIALRDQSPARVTLAPDVSLPAFSLCFETIERLIETFFGRLPCVDAAPQSGPLRAIRVRLRHGAHAFLAMAFRALAKNRNPFHCVPLILRATALSDRYTSPSYRNPFSSTSTVMMRSSKRRVRIVPGRGSRASRSPRRDNGSPSCGERGAVRRRSASRAIAAA